MNGILQPASLPMQAAAAIRDGIQRGSWTDHLPGERRLCGLLNVSRPTLRAALARLAAEGWLEVSQGRPRRILKPAAQLSASPHKVVGCLTPVPLLDAPPFVVLWVDALRALLAPRGYELEIHALPSCFSPRPGKALESLIRRTRPSVWVLYQATAVMQRWFMKRTLNTVVAGSCFPGVSLPSVDVDYRAACRHAAAQLLARGHRRIAFIARDTPLAGDLESESGFHEAFAHARSGGLNPVILRHHETVSNLRLKLHELFSDRASAPTALLVARSYHLLTVMTFLLGRGLRIPGDVALISRDDDEFLDHAVPYVARYRNDPALFARKLLRVILRQGAGSASGFRPMRLMPRFIKGDSLG